MYPILCQVTKSVENLLLLHYTVVGYKSQQQ
nr:MAG TPA: hypothetical protein [Caudoviricetes sp.]